ncbi:Chromatin modification- protein meaf6 [Coemansia asiatica]|uniref:Chromatin modification-related protein EAF6 n=1 Tax=Coemansia asiatica TaxID=1052880 RepID=A0A9W7XK79_9FUNG|nr:Chromatin modification- protein meaf6 [Coemansia asiatica]
MTNAKHQQRQQSAEAADNESAAGSDTKPAAASAAATSAANDIEKPANEGTTTATAAVTPKNSTSSTKPTGAKTNGKSSGGEGKVTKKMLKEAEQELFQLLLKKKQLDRSLIETESAIFDFETSYFENSGFEGNIVHGFEGYLASRNSEQRRQQHFSDADRIFSQSSATFKKAQEARIAASLLDSDSDESESSLAHSVRTNGVKKKAGGSTIRHGGRAGTPTGRGTLTPGVPKAATKKLRLSIDSGN